MLDKLKLFFRASKKILAMLAVVLTVTGLFSLSYYFTYTLGQMEACNAMLRKRPDTITYGLYCDHKIEGIVVRSAILKKSLFNITTGKTYFMISN